MKYLKLSILCALMLAAAPVFAQDFEDDDLGFDATDEAPVVEARDEVEIILNDNQFTIEEDMTFEKNTVMDIHIKYLKPWSKVHLEISKAGKVLSRNSFDANQLGELELEATTGNRNIGGMAEVRYITSSGKKITRKVKIRVR